MWGGVPLKIAIVGDLHLCSTNYGSHKDYARESLSYLQKEVEIAEDAGVGMFIHLGDLAQSRFTTLEYRLQVEGLFDRLNKLTHNNLYSLRGNHDKATYGMTEYDYYTSKGVIKRAEHLVLDNVQISMLDYNNEGCPILPPKEDKVNILLGHNTYSWEGKFTDLYGKLIDFGKHPEWSGLDLAILGHIHTPMYFTGDIDGEEVGVYYVGCPCRLSIDHKDEEEGHIFILDTETGKVTDRTFGLWAFEDSFVLADTKDLVKTPKVDVTDILTELTQHTVVGGNIEDKIQSLIVDERYKKKAIELLSN